MATVKHLVATALQPRPDHNFPKCLESNETQCLTDILGQDRVALVAAAVQILFGLNGRWEKQVCGLLCFVKDCERRAYLFQVFDLRRRAIIYEYSVPGTTRLDKCTDLFYTFDGATCRVGINFADRDEAQAFFHHFQRKQEDRRARREQRAQLLNAPEKNGPITPGESRSPKLSHDDKNKSGGLKKFFTVGRKTKIDISAPVRGTFDHRNAIKIDGCFFKDDDCRSLFNTVISEMNITPEEADYVRKKIGNVTDGFADFVTRKQRKTGVHPPTNENDDPSSKSSTATTSSTTRKNPNARRPFQDVAVPTFTHFQTTIVHHAAATSMAPPIPTRTRQNPVASPVSPPGPIPVAPPLPPPGPIPVAPPLPPPGPIPVAPPLPPPGPIRNDSLHSEVAVEKPAAAPGGKAQWLVDIESSKINLKKTPEKSPTPPTPPPVENSKQTMEEYILEFIKIRRKALMGKAQSDDEQVEDSDGFGDDFD